MRVVSSSATSRTGMAIPRTLLRRSRRCAAPAAEVSQPVASNLTLSGATEWIQAHANQSEHQAFVRESIIHGVEWSSELAASC
jgi:hypothetical protein